MKKILSVMLTVMMLASMFAVNASAMIVPETYSITDGAHDEAVYVNQDFSDIEANADLSTNTTGWGNVTVADGVLNFTGKEGENPSKNVGAITCNTPITYGEFKVSFDLRRNHEMTDEVGFYTTIMRAENADDANLFKYGAMVPINTLAKDTWYEYELTFSESAFEVQNEIDEMKLADPETYPKYSAQAGNIIAKAKRRVKGTEKWSNLGHYGGWVITDDAKFRSAASGMASLSSGTELQMFVQSYYGVKSEGYSNSDINVSLDNVKAWAPATAGITTVYDYPVNSDTILLTKLDGITVPTYAGGNATNNYVYTKEVTRPAENETKTMIVTFDAMNTVKGMPLLTHISGSHQVTDEKGNKMGPTNGFDILSTDEILNKWYTYKIVVAEKGSSLSIQKIFRKEADSTAPYEEYNAYFRTNVPADKYSEQAVAGWWNNYDITSAKFYVRGCLSSGIGNVRFGYSKQRQDDKVYDAKLTTEDLLKTKWEVKNVQVVDTASAVTGTATVADGVLTADLALVAGEGTATPVLAVYDTEGRLVDAAFKTVADGEGNVELSADYAEGNTATIFIWKELNAPIRSKVVDITAAIQ